MRFVLFGSVVLCSCCSVFLVICSVIGVWEVSVLYSFVMCFLFLILVVSLSATVFGVLISCVVSISLYMCVLLVSVISCV